MRRSRLLAAGLVLAAAGWAGAALADVVEAKGGMVRVLDRMTNKVTDYDLTPGQAQEVGRLSVRLDACRYPADQPMAEAYAHLTILDTAQPDPIFKGWMVASSPGLNALDHPRFDVWVLHCDVPASSLPAPDPTDTTPPDDGSGN